MFSFYVQSTCQPVMTCYKLVTVYFKWFGLQGRVENFIQNVSCSLTEYNDLNSMGHRHILQKNGPLTIEIAIIYLERMAH